MRTLPLMLLLAACTHEVDSDGDDLVHSDDPDVQETDETEAPNDSDTDVDDTVLVDTDDGDTDLVDTDVVDTDTDVVDTDTDVVDSDTDGVDSDTDPALDTDTEPPVDTDPLDADGDGFTADVDCDDADPALHPETCNGVDDGCAPGWTPAREDGLVSWQSADGRWIDRTADFPLAAPAEEVTVDESGTLWVCPGTYHAYVAVAGGTDVALRGPYGAAVTTLDADATSSVVRVVAPLASLVVEGLTLTDGRAACAYPVYETDCGARGGGVAVLATTKDVSVVDAVLSGNRAKDGGGGLFVGRANGGEYTGAPWSVDAPDAIRLVRTELSGNVGDEWGGGAWLGARRAGTIELDAVTASGNTGGTGSGGGAYVRLDDDAVLDVHDCTFDDNRAGGMFEAYSANGWQVATGGGLRVAASTTGTVRVRDSAFRRNVAVGVDDRSSRVYGYGAGLDLAQDGDGAVTLDGLELTDNVAGDAATGTSTGAGGGARIASSADVTITGCTLRGNRAGDATSTTLGGGGLALRRGATTAIVPTFHVIDSTIEANAAGLLGGGLLVEGVPVELEGTSIADNTLDHGLGLGVYVTGAGAALDLSSGSVVRGGAYASTFTTTTKASLFLDAGTSATCTGSASDRTGVLGYRASASAADGAIWLATGATFTAISCDLGEPQATDDNANGTATSRDLWLAGAAANGAYGDDATFTCDATGCP